MVMMDGTHHQVWKKMHSILAMCLAPTLPSKMLWLHVDHLHSSQQNVVLGTDLVSSTLRKIPVNTPI